MSNGLLVCAVDQGVPLGHCVVFGQDTLLSKFVLLNTANNLEGF